MVIDAEGISAVSMSSGGNFKPPNVLFSLFRVALSSLLDAKTAVKPVGSNVLGCMVVAFDDDLVKHEDDGNVSLVLGNLTVNATGVASFEANFPPCARAAEEAAC
jgi:hypothetical protein